MTNQPNKPPTSELDALVDQGLTEPVSPRLLAESIHAKSAYLASMPVDAHGRLISNQGDDE